jgi:hypothetical protein
MAGRPRLTPEEVADLLAPGPLCAVRAMGPPD